MPGVAARDRAGAASAPPMADGERKEVSVLFADITGSFALIADRDPEIADAILSDVIHQLIEAAHRYGGTVNKIRGDGIMALFGAPVAHEDHAARACYAALAMRAINPERLRRINGGVDVPIAIRTGINSGEAVLRQFATDISVDYDAVGEVVHLASRMEETAEPGTIRLTSATFRLVKGLVETRPLGRKAVKGLAQSVEVYELTGMSSSPASIRPIRDGELTPFVDREAEFDGLRQALKEAATGKGQLVAVIGEAGLGKSRLLGNLIELPEVADWRVLKGGSYSYDKLTTYLPFVRIFQSFFAIGVDEEPSSVRAKIGAGLAALNAETESTVPALFNLLGVEPKDSAWAELDPQERRQHLVDAICSVLLLASRARPLILILEDLHWIDSETQNVIDQLVESVARSPILCVVTYRPEYRHEWGGKLHYRQLRLEVLPDRHAALLLQSLIGLDPQVTRLKEILLQQTEANPLFLEQRVHSLVDDGIFAGVPGAYQLVGSIETLRVPGTVKAVLAARIDRLRPQEKRVLQSAAVIGATVPLAILRLVENCSETELRDATQSLQTAGFLVETQTHPEIEYSFRHNLIHDVAFGVLLRDRRSALHAKVLYAMEALHEGRASEFAESLARHAVGGRLWDKAVQYSRMAGGKAAWRSANQEAVSFFEQALDALGHLADDTRSRALAFDIRLDLRNPLVQLGRIETLTARLREAELVAESMGDQARLAKVLMYLNHVFWVTGRQDAAFALGEKALALAQALGDEEREVRTRFHLGLSHLALCEFKHTIEIMRDTVSYCEKAALSGPLGPLASMALGYMVRSLAEIGDFAEATTLATESVRLAEAEGRPFSSIIAYLCAGHVHHRKGDHERAIPLLERGVALCRATEARLMTPVATGFLGAAYTDAGRLDDAIPLLVEAVETGKRIKLLWNQPMRLVDLSRAYIDAGQFGAAEAWANEGETMALEQRDPAARAEALLLRNEIEFGTGRFDIAVAGERCRLALRIAEDLAMRPLVAHCHRALGEMELRGGNPLRGRDELHRAEAIYAELGMTGWLIHLKDQRVR